MTIESMLLAKNRDQFNNIINFMRSLIFMNNIEAEEVETTDTLENYERYEGAYLAHDSSLSYNYSVQQLVDFGFLPLEAEKYYEDPKTFQTDVMNGNALCKAFLNSLRKQRVKEYVENNPYYRQFCGLPYDSDQYISVINNDRNSENDPETIYLHEVNITDYPNTYARLYYERDIDKIYKDHNYMYLIFIENPMDPYVVRNKEQFDICYYDNTILSTSELQYWFEVYNKARNEIMLNDYIEAFQYSYKAYNNVELMFILSLTFNLYCGKMLEKYAVRDFTDTEVLDIIESNDLNELKSLSMSLLRKIVDRLPDLKAYTGTERVIDIIFDIVADSSISVKRYYLKKKYNVDTEGNTVIDQTQLYDKSVDLVFEEKTIKKGETSTDNFDQEYDYSTVAMTDDTWGGTYDAETEEQKLAIKEAMKKELLKADFSSVMTKYISVSKIVDMNVKIIDLSNKLGLIYQYCKNKNNKISNDKVIYDGIETTALSIYAAWCIVYGMINGLSDPDKIPSDSTIVEGVMKLRSTNKLQADALAVADLVIDLGKGNFSESETITNDKSEDIKLKDYLDGITETVSSKHPKFSHFSLKKIALDEIDFTPHACYTFTGNIANESIGYDSRKNIKSEQIITETDNENRTKVTKTTIHYGLNNNTESVEVVSIDDGFDENNIVNNVTEDPVYTENPDYRKLFMYNTIVDSYIKASGTSKVYELGLFPISSYNEDDLFDSIYAYDSNRFSSYTEITTWVDGSGNTHKEYSEYKYTPSSNLPVLNKTWQTTDKDFDITDPNVVKTTKTETIANTDYLKVYVYNNGDWEEVNTGWSEMTLTVDKNRNIIIPAGASFNLYEVFDYVDTVGDYLTEEEIEKYLVSFNNASSMTVEELFSQYDKNYEIIEAIKEKINKTYGFQEYQIWETLYNANMAYMTINDMFNGASNYSEYIKSVSTEMYEHIDGLLSSITELSDLIDLEKKLHEAYGDYIEDLSEGNAKVYSSEADVAGGEDLTDITKLFEQFVSLYTQLLKSSYNVSYDNESSNSLILLYSAVRQTLNSKEYDMLELVDQIYRDKLVTNAEDFLELTEFIISKLNEKHYEYMDLLTGYYKKGTTTYSDDDFVTDEPYKDILSTISRDYFDLRGEIVHDIKKDKYKEIIGLYDE